MIFKLGDLVQIIPNTSIQTYRSVPGYICLGCLIGTISKLREDDSYNVRFFKRSVPSDVWKLFTTLFYTWYELTNADPCITFRINADKMILSTVSEQEYIEVLNGI